MSVDVQEYELDGAKGRMRRRLFAVLAAVVGLATGIAVLAGGSMAASKKFAAATATPTQYTVAVIGDGLSTGLGTGTANAWPNLINNDPAEKGALSLFNASQNGSGYVSIGDNDSTFGSQVALAVGDDTQMVLFFGSDNDLGNDAATVQAAAAATYAEAREQAPDAVLVVVGPLAFSNESAGDRLVLGQALKEAAAEAGAMYVDPLAEGWVAGLTGNLFGADGDHPTAAGQKYLEQHMEAVIADARATGTTPVRARTAATLPRPSVPSATTPSAAASTATAPAATTPAATSPSATSPAVTPPAATSPSAPAPATPAPVERATVR